MWEAGYVLEQLRAGGVLEAVRIAVAGEQSHPGAEADCKPWAATLVTGVLISHNYACLTLYPRHYG